MNRDQPVKIEGPIRKGLIFAGLYFRTGNACCRYKSLGPWKRPQWRKDNPDDFVLLSDLQPNTASLEENETSAAPPPRPVAPTVAYGITKAEVLSRAKAAIEAGESPHNTAERLAWAHEDFHASQREIGRAIGLSASSVSRLLKWRRSGYQQCSPFGPTTRAGRAAHRRHNKNDSGGCGSDDEADHNGKVSLAGPCSPPYQPVSPPATVSENLPSGSTETEPLPSAEAATTETEGARTETTPLEGPGGRRGRNGSRQRKKQKRPARNSRVGQKLTPERMQTVIDALKECPFLGLAAAKAGIHRKGLTYWLKRSAAGDDGYDIEVDGIPCRFHELCQYAIEEAHDMLFGFVWLKALGLRYKTDPRLVALGYEGLDACARDEDGCFILERVGRGNPKMLRYCWERMCPEECGKHPKRDIPKTGGVLVIGERNKKPKNSCAASIKARQWKAHSRWVRETKD